MAGVIAVPNNALAIAATINRRCPLTYNDRTLESITVNDIKFAINPPVNKSVISNLADLNFVDFDNSEFVCILPTKIESELFYTYKRKAFKVGDTSVETATGRLKYEIPRFFYHKQTEYSFGAGATIVTKNGVFKNCVPVSSVTTNGRYTETYLTLPLLFNIGTTVAPLGIQPPTVSPRPFGDTLISDILYFYPTNVTTYKSGATTHGLRFVLEDTYSTSESILNFGTGQNGATYPESVNLNAVYSIFKNIIFVKDELEYNLAIAASYYALIDKAFIYDGNPIPPYTPPGGGDGGYGEQSNSSNTVTGSFDGTPGPSIVENLPNGSSGADIASSGMYTKYLCNNALLNLLAEFFWEDNVGIQALKAVLGNPIDSIISLTAYPFALDTLVPKTLTTIYFGQYDSHFSAFSLTKSSFQIDWGTVTIPFFWGSFLDYSPYTKIQLYLPWGVGFVSIDPNEVVPWSSKNSYNKADFVNGTIRVITNIELDKGACVHNIIGNNGRIIGSFGGVVGKQVPVTGSDNSARILSMMSAAISSSAAVGMSAGGAVAAGKNLAYGKGMTMAERAEGREMIGNYKSSVGGAIQSLSGGLASPPSYPRAGTFSDATNTLGYQYPYLIISRPSQSVPQQYGRFMGYPSNIFHAHLGEVKGYTEVSSIHLENINATANELDELESILKGGVLL